MFSLCIITHVLVCPVGVALAPRMLQIFFSPVITRLYFSGIELWNYEENIFFAAIHSCFTHSHVQCAIILWTFYVDKLLKCSK